MLVFEETGKLEYPEKTFRSREEHQQHTEPTYDAGTGINPIHIGGRRICEFIYLSSNHDEFYSADPSRMQDACHI